MIQYFLWWARSHVQNTPAVRARGKDCASARIWSLSWCPCVELKQAINGLDIQIVRKQQWSRSAPAVCWLLRQVWEASVQCCVVRAAGTGLAGAGIQPVSQLASCEQHGACNNCCSTQPRTLYAAHQGRTLQLLHVMARVSAVSCHARSILRRSRPGHNCNGKYLWKPF